MLMQILRYPVSNVRNVLKTWVQPSVREELKIQGARACLDWPRKEMPRDALHDARGVRSPETSSEKRFSSGKLRLASRGAERRPRVTQSRWGARRECRLISTGVFNPILDP
jgi:hypothetical protein